MDNTLPPLYDHHIVKIRILFKSISKKDEEKYNKNLVYYQTALEDYENEDSEIRKIRGMEKPIPPKLPVKEEYREVYFNIGEVLILQFSEDEDEDTKEPIVEFLFTYRSLSERQMEVAQMKMEDWLIFLEKYGASYDR